MTKIIMSSNIYFARIIFTFMTIILLKDKVHELDVIQKVT